jgi:VanZ family protein
MDSPARSSRTLLFVQYWLPVLLWMAVIFSLSTGAGSTRHTSRILGAVLRWFHPTISDGAIQRVQTVVRKGSHLAEYALLALLLWRALRKPDRGDVRPWSWREAALACALAVSFAASDEWHQSWVAERQGQVTDVLIDASGAMLGLGAIWTFGRRSGRW